jgi:hypothetical protein
MASRAQGDQVLLCIIAAVAPKFFVVNLQIGPGAATLAPPAVTSQHLLPKAIVQLGLQLKARLFGPDSVHEAFSVTSCRKACRCSPGRNLKNLVIDCREVAGNTQAGSQTRNFWNEDASCCNKQPRLIFWHVFRTPSNPTGTMSGHRSWLDSQSILSMPQGSRALGWPSNLRFRSGNIC